MMRDRVASDTLQLTQEFLSWMLGVRNQAVSRAAKRLQGDGSIRYSRGTLEILVSNNLLAQELGFQSDELIARLQKLSPASKINKLRFRVGSIS